MADAKSSQRIALAGTWPMLMVGGVNFFMFLHKLDSGGDFVGYFNATVIAFGVAYVMFHRNSEVSTSV